MVDKHHYIFQIATNKIGKAKKKHLPIPQICRTTSCGHDLSTPNWFKSNLQQFHSPDILVQLDYIAIS